MRGNNNLMTNETSISKNEEVKFELSKHPVQYQVAQQWEQRETYKQRVLRCLLLSIEELSDSRKQHAQLARCCILRAIGDTGTETEMDFLERLDVVRH